MRKFKYLIWLMIFVVALALVACGGDSSDSSAQDESDESGEAVVAGDPAAGEAIYAGTCSACHGPDAKGLPNLGKDLTTSEFVDEKTDAELLAFVKTGRPVGDPLNTSGVDMPPKGGNPALGDEDILDAIAYLRSIHE